MGDERPVLVTAGLIFTEGKVLICQRHHTDPYGMQWEFPGGKVKENEDTKRALARELAEELAIEAQIGEEVFRLRHCYPDRYVEVIFFRIPAYRGVAENRIFEKIEWVDRNRLTQYRFLEADREIVRLIANGEIT